MPSVCLALLVSFGLAQSDAGTGVLTKAPALVTQVPAEFPPELLDAGQGGTVVMEIDLSDTGDVTDAKVVQSAGAAFDASALKAIRQFKFSPAEIDGHPAAVRLQYSQQFFFKPQRDDMPIDAGFDDGGVGLAPVNLAGQLVERGTRIPLPGLTVVVGEGEAAQETVSADDGTFSFRGVPLGSIRVAATGPGYDKYVTQETVTEGQRTQVLYYVRRSVYGAFETTVRAQKERKDVASISLKQEEIRLIPGTNGDAFKVIQNLPGVARVPYGLGFLVVRGSKAWDTKVYVDDTNVPLLFHFGGLFATFNSSLIENLDFQPGNFGAEWGRDIGGLVTTDVRTPAQNGYHGYVDANVVDASFLVEGPIDENWSFAVSGRRSYIDAVLPVVFDLFVPQAKSELSFTVAPRYYDWQVRFERKPKNGKTRFFVQMFGSDDRLRFVLPNPAIDPEGRGDFGTYVNYNRAVAGFDWRISEMLSFKSRSSIGFDKLNVSAGSDVSATGTQFPIASRDTLTITLPHAVSLDVGLDLFALPYQLDVQTPPPPKLDQIPDPFVSRQLVSEKANNFTFEPAVFVNALWKPFDWLKVVGGVHADWETQMNKGWLDPRLAVFVQPWASTLFKGAVGLYHQPPDYRLGELDPVFGNPNLLPEGAEHYMIGGEHHFTDAISLDLQFYYKVTFHEARATLAPSSGDVNVDASDLHYTSIGHGRTYGMELLLRHALTKNFFGWIAYSLSKSERDYNGGTKWGLSPFDQPHNLIVVASYKLPYDFIAGVRLRYTSGPLNTPYVGAIYDANANYYYPLFGDPYSKRLPDFFQLDVRVDRRFVFQRWQLSLYLDVQNVTNRRNVEAAVNNFNYTKTAYLQGLPILPTFGIRGEW